MNEGPLLSVIVPVYNEAATIDALILRVRASPVDKEIIVVDDGSTDGTRTRLEALEAAGGVTARYHPHNRGKGAAVRTGLAEARGRVVVIQDADLEYDPAEYPSLLAPILDDRADAVFGTRFGGSSNRVLYYWHRVGNGVLTTFSNFATDLNLTDMETCYKAVRRELLQSLWLTQDRFGIEPEITAKLARAGARVYEVPVSYRGRTYAEGKKIGWRDGMQAILCIWKYGILHR